MKVFYQSAVCQLKSYKRIVLLLAIAVFLVCPAFSTFAENVDTQVKEKTTIAKERKIFIHEDYAEYKHLANLIFSEFGFVAVRKICCYGKAEENFWGGIIKADFLHEQEMIEFTSSFVKNGGRAIFLVDRLALGDNHLFQEHFSLSLFPLPEEIKNSVIYREKKLGKFIMDGETFSPLFEGLTISLIDSVDERGEKYPFSLLAVLAPVGDDWVYNYIDIDGIKSCLSAWRKLGKGEVLFLSHFDLIKQGDLSTSQFFDDFNINNDQNREATKRLIEWLVGKTDYALFSNREIN